EGITTLHAAGDEKGEGLARGNLARVDWLDGDPSGALRELAEAETLLARTGGTDDLLGIEMHRSWFLSDVPDHEHAVGAARDVVEQAEKAPDAPKRKSMAHEAQARASLGGRTAFGTAALPPSARRKIEEAARDEDAARVAYLATARDGLDEQRKARQAWDGATERLEAARIEYDAAVHKRVAAEFG